MFRTYRVIELRFNEQEKCEKEDGQQLRREIMEKIH